MRDIVRTDAGRWLLIIISLQSGSNGNCIYVESGPTRLLFDAGLSGIQAERRLARLGRDIRQVHALIISHDHADHVSCAGIYQRKFRLPVYISGPTFAAARRRFDLGPVDDIRHLHPGRTLHFDGVIVETIPTPHDAVDGSAFIVEAEGRRLGILTDLGWVFDALPDVVRSLDAVVLESNYDADMLENGPYPRDVQERIRGPGGHLSNFEAAELLRECAAPRLQWACLAHLSEQNNSPRLALRTHRRIVPKRLKLLVAGRHEPVALPQVR